MSLRVRLLLALVGLVAVGLVVSGVVTYASLRSYLVSQLDAQLKAEAQTVAVNFGLESAGFGRGRSAIFTSPGTWVQVRDASGTPVSNEQGDALSPPVLSNQLPGSGAASDSPVTFTTPSEDGTFSYRVYVYPVRSFAGGTVVVAFPLSSLHATLNHLLLIEILVTVVILGGLAALSWVIVRRELRPLQEMADTAGAIAVGDLSQRVTYSDDTTEVGRLGMALNRMLGEIEEAFDARTASEERLRRFLADASHELRTPLTSIRGYAEIFDRGARDRPADLETSMHHIRDEANRMSVLVDDLLLLARLDHERPLAKDRVDLVDVTASAVDAARVAAPDRSITLRVEGAVVVMGDAGRLRQVVDNLLTNARQYTPAATPIEVSIAADGADAVLAVRDHGPGVPAGEERHIFEPFHRADPSRARTTGGVGLGLAIVSAITRAHGGTAGVTSGAEATCADDGATAGAAAAGHVGESRPEGAPSAGPPGSVFWVRLPLVPSQPPVAEPLHHETVG